MPETVFTLEPGAAVDAGAFEHRLDELTDALTLNPSAAAVDHLAIAGMVGRCEVVVCVDGHHVGSDQPRALGGTDRAPSPTKLLLAALAACTAQTYRIWAARLGMRLDEVEVGVRATQDVRGQLGVQPGVRSGLEGIELEVLLRGPEPRGAYECLRHLADAHSPVRDLLAHATSLATRLRVETR